MFLIFCFKARIYVRFFIKYVCIVFNTSTCHLHNIYLSFMMFWSVAFIEYNFYKNIEIGGGG